MGTLYQLINEYSPNVFMLSQCIYPFSESICIVTFLHGSLYVVGLGLPLDWGDTIVCNFPPI